jgi:hypothetical protein
MPPINLLEYRSTPIGSLMDIPKDTSEKYFTFIFLTPSNIQSLLISARTGAFIRGLAKTYNIPIEKAPKIAFAVLQIALGEKTLAQLGSLLSTELPAPNDVAQKIANEIEKELFAPIALELNQYLAKKKQATLASRPMGGASNVLNLKNTPQPPPPPPIPKKFANGLPGQAG